MYKERNIRNDVFRGILIFLVVFAHYQRDTIHDFIFLFHMPMFFVLSGFLLQKKKLLTKNYLINKTTTLLVPYCVYLLLDFLLVRRDYSFGSFAHLIYGGRSIPGVYWYITCFLFALFLFALILRKCSDRIAKCIILAGGGIAILESHLAEYIPILQSPGIPWNLDVSLMALVYIGIGFFYKDKIKELMVSNSAKYDIIAGVITVLLCTFCYLNYSGEKQFYYFDMKPVYYKELFSAILIPCTFGFVLARIVHWTSNLKWLKVVQDFLALCGRVTIPIMFLHIPLNHWKDTLMYNRVIYVVIGVLLPLLFTILFNRITIMRKLFGLPKLDCPQSPNFAHPQNNQTT